MTSSHNDPPLLRVMVGSPGSGKTTLCQAQQAVGRWGVRVSLDDARARFGADAHDQTVTIQAVAWVLNHVDQLLRHGLEVTIDATSTTASERANWLTIAAAHQTPAIAVIVRTPLALARRRNAARERPVPDDVVVAMGTHLATLTTGQLLAEGFAHVTEHTPNPPREDLTMPATCFAAPATTEEIVLTEENVLATFEQLKLAPSVVMGDKTCLACWRAGEGNNVHCGNCPCCS